MKSSLVVWLKLYAKHCSLFCSSLNTLWGAIKTVNALETASDLIPNKNKMQITKLIFHTYPKCITHLPPFCPTKSLYESRNAIKLIVYDFILSFLTFMSYCTNWHLISLGHRLIADLISHLGCSLCVLISESQRISTMWLLTWTLQIFLQIYRFFLKIMCTYRHACVYMCIHLYFFATPERLVIFFPSLDRQDVVGAAVQGQYLQFLVLVMSKYLKCHFPS